MKTLLALCLALVVFTGMRVAPVFASTSGVDTPTGVHDLPLAVEGNAIIDLNDSTTPPTAVVNGNLGIGTAPSQALDVNGNANVVGGITAGLPVQLPTGYTVGAPCASNGLIAYSAGSNKLVYCKNLVWTAAQTPNQTFALGNSCNGHLCGVSIPTAEYECTSRGMSYVSYTNTGNNSCTSCTYANWTGSAWTMFSSCTSCGNINSVTCN